MLFPIVFIECVEHLFLIFLNHLRGLLGLRLDLLLARSHRQRHPSVASPAAVGRAAALVRVGVRAEGRIGGLLRRYGVDEGTLLVLGGDVALAVTAELHAGHVQSVLLVLVALVRVARGRRDDRAARQHTVRSLALLLKQRYF